jgi:CRP/FNR family transcriptional regulator, cyclic AMP receptor protein
MNPANLFDHDADALQLVPGDFLFREGDKRDNMYVLLEGEMDIRLGDHVVETAGPGGLIGVIALLDDSPRDTNAVAKTACRLATVDQRRFHFLIQQHPQFSTHVMKELAHRLRHMTVAAKQHESSTSP